MEFLNFRLRYDELRELHTLNERYNDVSFGSIYSSYSYFVTSLMCDAKTHSWNRYNIAHLIIIIFGILNLIVCLILALRFFHLLSSAFIFINSFLLACFMNLLAEGLHKIQSLISLCWYGGQLSCETVAFVSDNSENAMIFFLVAVILEQNHPRIRECLSKNLDKRMLTCTLVVWGASIVLAIPEILVVDLSEVHDKSGSLCMYSASDKHLSIHVKLSVAVEYVIPFFVLLFILIHAAYVKLHSQSPEPEERIIEGSNSSPESISDFRPFLGKVSLFLGVLFFVTRIPYYIVMIFWAFHRHLLWTKFMVVIFEVAVFANLVIPVLAPVVILFGSPSHKKVLKECSTSILSRLSGRRVGRGFVLGVGGDGMEEHELN